MINIATKSNSTPLARKKKGKGGGGGIDIGDVGGDVAVATVAVCDKGETKELNVLTVEPKVTVVEKAPEPSPKNDIDTVEVTEELNSRYSKLFTDGYLVNIHVSVWGMSANLSEEDLKIEKVSKFIKLGKKMLIDPEHLNVFKNQESKSRRYLYKNSYDFPISDAHFVPKKRLADVLAQLEIFKQEFNTLVDLFLANYEIYKDAVLEHKDYKDIADLLRPLYPDVGVLKKKFGFSISVFELAMPRAFESVNAEEMEKLNTALRGQHERSLEQLEQFVEDSAVSLRAQLSIMCNTILKKIDTQELISKANLNTIKTEIDNFYSLNFLNDTTVAKAVGELETLVNENRNFKTDEENVKLLRTALINVLDKVSGSADIADLRTSYFKA